jgi:hypothetical protein
MFCEEFLLSGVVRSLATQGLVGWGI